MITKRGKRVRALGIAILLYVLFHISANVWWVGIGAPTADFLGWCFDGMTECVVL